MSYRQAYLSALKFSFHSQLYTNDNVGVVNSMEVCRRLYKRAKFNAASYTFNMKSDDLKYIPVW